MDFGKLNDISKVDFSLPLDHPHTAKTLQKVANPAQELEVFVGCPVWATDAWVGKWYPSGTQSKDFLRHYARQFNTIELNTTHYRIPDFTTIERWRESTPPSFRFCPKILQTISHSHLLQNIEALMNSFCESVWQLQDRLGVCFLQLPPYFSPDKLAILEDFVKSFPPEIALAIEFRNEGWFKKENNEPFDTATQILEDYQISTVLCDVSGRRDVLHQRLTTATAVVRFVGNSLHPSDYQRIDDWVTRIKIWQEQGLKKLYFFMHEPDNVLSPELVLYFIEKINKACNLHLKKPTIYQNSVQANLF